MNDRLDMTTPEQARAIQEAKEAASGRRRGRRPLWRRLLAWLGMGLVLCLVLVLTTVAGLFWWLRTDSAHDFIVEQVNPILAEGLAPQGLGAVITRLDGDLPLSASVGLVVSDSKGIWLTVPELRFGLDWSWQDRTVFLRELACVAPEVARLPELPAQPEDTAPPSPALAPEALRRQLEQAGQALFTLPDWLPRVVVDKIAIEKAKVAADVLGFDLVADLGLKASFSPTGDGGHTPAGDGKDASTGAGGPQASFALTALDLESDIVRLRISLNWESAPARTGLLPWLDGPLSGSAAVEFAPPASGQGGLAQGGLLTEALATVPALAKPASLSLSLAGTTLAPQLGLQMDAAGLEGKASTTVSLPADDWGQDWAALPRLAADMALHIGNWQDINKFAPGLDLSGLVDISLHAANADGPLNGRLDLGIPRFAMGQQLALNGIAGHVAIEDALGTMRCDTSLDAAQIAAAGMKLGAALRLDGPLSSLLASGGAQPGQPGATPGSGPVRLALETHGDVSAKLNAQWQSGSLHMPACVVRLPQGTVELAARLSGLPGLTGTASQPSGDFRIVARDVDARRFVPNLPLEPFDITLTGKLGRTLEAKLDLPSKTLKALGADSMKCTASLPLAYAANGVPAPDSKAPLKAQLVWHGQIAPLWALVPQADRRLKGRLDMDVQVGGSMEAPSLKGKVAVGQCRFEDVALGVLLQDMGLHIALDGRMGQDSTPDGQAHLDFVAQDGTGGKFALKGKSRLDGTGLDMRATLDNLRPLRRQDVRVALSGQAHVSGEATAPDVRGEIRINLATILLDNIAAGADSVTTLPITDDTKAAARKARKKAPADPRRDKTQTAAAASARSAAKPAPTGKRGSLHLDITTPGRIIVDGRGLVSEWKTEMQIRGTPDEPVISGGLRATKGKLDFMNRMFELTRGTVTFAGGSVANPMLDIFLTNTRQGFTSHIAVTGPVKKMQLELSSEPPMPRDEVLSHILFGRNVNELGRLETLQLAAAVAQLAGLGNGGNPLEFTREALGVDVLRVNSGSAAGGNGDGKDNGIGNTSVEAGKYLTEDIYIGVQQGAKPNSTAGILELELTPRTRVQVRSEQNNTGAQLNWKMDY